ncbi:hypothetical protein C4577_03045 [Candidatus Parcubacteria bacterium]|nr:MAG: hypothetical protein C4577_03045 [Candidatus Parcubacteria bacterium]
MTKLEYRDLLVKCALDGTFPSFRKATETEINIQGKNKIQCCYRSPDGKKCAAGIIIPDELYDSRYEGKNASYTLRALNVPIPNGLSYADLDDIQECHDELVECWDKVAFINHMNELSCFRDLPPTVNTTET